MRDRARLKALGVVQGLSQAVRARDEAGLRAARAAETRAAEERDAASRRASAAVDSWADHLAQDRFAPEISRLLGRAVQSSVDAVDSAEARLHVETVARRTAEHRWIAQDARCRVSDALVAAARRRVARADDERAMAAGADRTAYLWRAR